MKSETKCRVLKLHYQLFQVIYINDKSILHDTFFTELNNFFYKHVKEIFS